MRYLAQSIVERPRDPSEQRRCSFCGRGESRVGELIAGVEFCNGILEHEPGEGLVA